MASDGFQVQVGNEKLRVKLHLMLVGGVMPALAKMAGALGHMAYYGCRFCYIEGKASVINKSWYTYNAFDRRTQWTICDISL